MSRPFADPRRQTCRIGTSTIALQGAPWLKEEAPLQRRVSPLRNNGSATHARLRWNSYLFIVLIAILTEHSLMAVPWSIPCVAIWPTSSTIVFYKALQASTRSIVLPSSGRKSVFTAQMMTCSDMLANAAYFLAVNNWRLLQQPL